MTGPNCSRRGTILVFFIAAMAIVSVLVISLLKTQSEQAASISVAESRLIADSMALSGIEIMATIDDQGPAAELTNRYRSFPDANQYGFGRLFGLDSSPAQSLLYMPPLEYPPIRGVALRYPTVDVPGVAFNNDIRLMNVLCGLPVNVTLTVPGTTIAGNNGGAVLPTTACRPQPSDPEHDDFPVNAGSRYISALNHNTIGWYAPKNSPVPLPNTAKITGVAGSEKVPPPSFVFVRDQLSPLGLTYRCFIYAWYARRSATDYLMTSGRVREILVSGGVEYLGNEIAVSSTQLR